MAHTKSTGMGFTGWLALLFIALKLTGYLDWSWWWVLSPLWISLGVAVTFLVIAMVATAMADRPTRRRR